MVVVFDEKACCHDAPCGWTSQRNCMSDCSECCFGGCEAEETRENDQRVLSMKLFRIKNKYMYQSKNKKEENEKHIYAIYRDKKTKELRAIRTTHLYEKGKARQIDQGILKVEKFHGIKHPSGVSNKYTRMDINGKPLTYKGVKAKRLSKSNIPRRQAKRIRKFAKNPWK